MKRHLIWLIVGIGILIAVLIGYSKKHNASSESFTANPLFASAFETVGLMPLHRAAWNGDIKEVNLLLKEGADVNSKCKDGMTPLHLAGVFGRTETVKVLIANGADIEATNEKGETPLALAATGAHPATVELLLSHGANPKATDKDGRTPIERVLEFQDRIAGENFLVRNTLSKYNKNLKKCGELLRNHDVK